MTGAAVIETATSATLRAGKAACATPDPKVLSIGAGLGRYRLSEAGLFARMLQDAGQRNPPPRPVEVPCDMGQVGQGPATAQIAARCGPIRAWWWPASTSTPPPVCCSTGRMLTNDGKQVAGR